MNPLKILHIATFINGGAGTAAYRIHEALLTSGVDSNFLSVDEPLSGDAKKVSQVEKPAFSVVQRMCRKLRRIIAANSNFGIFDIRYHLRHRLDIKRPSLRYEVASLPFSDFDIFSHPLYKSADIIHLHWVAGLLDYPSFFIRNNKPLAWTFHDLNPIQGLFHYEEDEIRNKPIAGKLDKTVYDIKRKSVKKNEPALAIISPSNWLFKHVAQSKWFPDSTLHHIPYSLDTDVFNIKNTSMLKRELGIPEGNTIFLFVSQSITNFRKGFDLLVEALSTLNNKTLTLLTIGYAEELKIAEFNCVNLGSIYDIKKLSGYYSLADAFIIPSREDNLPNVLLESLACGTPVISFNTGGMAEVIIDGLNGIKAKELNAIALQQAMEMFIANKSKFCANEIRQFALDHFSQKLIAEQYKDIYRKLVR